MPIKVLDWWGRIKDAWELLPKWARTGIGGAVVTGITWLFSLFSEFEPAQLFVLLVAAFVIGCVLVVTIDRLVSPWLVDRFVFFRQKGQDITVGSVYVFAGYAFSQGKGLSGYGKPGDLGYPNGNSDIGEYLRLNVSIGTSEPTWVDFSRRKESYKPSVPFPPSKEGLTGKPIRVERIWLLLEDALSADAVDWTPRAVSDYEELSVTFAIPKTRRKLFKENILWWQVFVKTADGKDWRSSRQKFGFPK